MKNTGKVPVKGGARVFVLQLCLKGIRYAIHAMINFLLTAEWRAGLLFPPEG